MQDGGASQCAEEGSGRRARAGRTLADGLVEGHPVCRVREREIQRQEHELGDTRDLVRRAAEKYLMGAYAVRTPEEKT